jgi:hypothetical protein
VFVYGLNVGQKFWNGFGVEVRMEDEKVVPALVLTQKQETCCKAKVGY